jgi:penicillin amidase
MKLRLRSAVALALACTFPTGCGDGAKKTATPADATDANTADTQGNSDAAADADVAGDATGTTQTAAQTSILGVKQTETWTLPGLTDTVQVVRTEGDVPHIYAKNRKDLSRVMGFVTARHRYFQMELTRRLGLGTLSELLGDAALGKDQEARSSGSAYVAKTVEELLTPEEAEVFDAFAAGINDFIGQVVAKKLPEPSEIAIAKLALGGTSETLMKPWNRHDVAGASAAIIYNLGYETDDVGRTAHLAELATKFEGKALGDLRKAGALQDIEYHVTPIKPVSSASGLGLDLDGKAVAKTENGKVPGKKDAAWLPAGLPTELLQRAIARDAAWQKRSGHDRQNGFGSNAWAVSAKGTPDGVGIVAGDGHLPLSVPSLFYQIGMDDSVFGAKPASDGKATHQMGLVIPGLPLMAVGTNGRVGWSQTQLVGDITDWYREEIKLDAKGVPATALYLGKDLPLQVFSEVYTIADVPALGSKGRTETWQRWTTADGRWITDIEGPAVDAKYEAKAGETVVNLSGKRVVPQDQDGDGKITAISFDFTGLDKPKIINAIDGFGHSADVFEMRDHSRKLVAYSQNIAAADSDGRAFYTGYQAVPCRKNLPRDKDGNWLPGADPKLLIDGTKYGGFTIPTLPDGRVDESQASSADHCVVPFDDYPQSIDPDQGYVVTANNDPGNLSTDDSLRNDKWYIGGPWANGYRADTISQGLKKAVASKSADLATMATIQASNGSRLGDEWAPFLLQAVTEAKGLQTKDSASLTGEEQRVIALYAAMTPTGLDQAVTRLQKWHDAGSPALSGVPTFYHVLTAGEVDHAVATSIFNAWFGRFIGKVFDDEGLDVWEPWGADAHTRALSWIRDGRGPNNPKKQASWNPATQESAFFDILDTTDIESSREVALLALQEALATLPGKNDGFGTADMTQWLWGYRHGVHFDSILASFLGSNPDFAALTENFSINPQLDAMHLADKFEKGDPRANLTQFPRGGDAFAVDAAGGINASGYGSGPVFRMVIAMGKTRTTGQNILPGGQSGMTNSPNFYDQARLWLANQAWPLRYEVDEVVAGALGREVYTGK